MIIGVDMETCSAADIDDGAAAYAAHKTTRVHCAVFAVAEGPQSTPNVIVWTPHAGWLGNVRVLNDALKAYTPLLAHGVHFESSIWKHTLNWPTIPLTQWRCSIMRAALCNLPLGLASLGAAIGATVKKDIEGQTLMKRLAIVELNKKTGEYTWPKPTPDEMGRLIDYCKTDVLSMLDCWWRLPRPPVAELEMMLIDQKINERGMLLDQQLAERIRQMAIARERMIGCEVWELTNDMLGVRSPDALKSWLKGQGIELPTKPVKAEDGSWSQTETIDRAAIAELLENSSLPEKVRNILDLRVETGRITSIAKAARVPNVVSPDGRLRWVLRYAMAHPGRWTSEGLQMHNLAKPTKAYKKIAGPFLAAVRGGDLNLAAALHPVLEGLSFSLRALVCAPPGRDLIGGDYSAIEARILAWNAGQDDALAAFADPTRDIYIEDAAKADSDDRDLGKEARLGLGYGMGAIKFYNRVLARMQQAGKVSPDWTLKRARQVQLAWRKNNPLIVKFWHDLQNAVATVIEDNSQVISVGRCIVTANSQLLRIGLPSGRFIYFWRPSQRDVMKEIKTVDAEGNIVVDTVLMRELRYYTPLKGGMELETTYGGKLTENVTQAIGRELLRDALRRLDPTIYEVVLHVHDSITAEVDEGKGSVDEFAAIMAAVPSWAKGLPIAVEGYRAKHFKG